MISTPLTFPCKRRRSEFEAEDENHAPANLSLSKRICQVQKENLLNCAHSRSRESCCSKINEIRRLTRKGPLWFEDLTDLNTVLVALKFHYDLPSFEARLSALSTLFKPSSQGEWLMWATALPRAKGEQPVHLKIALSTAPYTSQAIKEDAIPASPIHYYLDITESIGCDEPQEKTILHMRFSQANGELVRLDKGNKLSGSEVLGMAKLFHDYFDIPLYIYDDAQVESAGAGTPIYLKLSALGDPAGKTWYQRALGDVHAARGKWRLAETAVEVDQDRYQEALEAVRTAKICDLWEFFKYDGVAKEFKRAVTSTFKSELEAADGADKAAFVSACSHTLQELCAANASVVKAPGHPLHREALKVMGLLHTSVIGPPEDHVLPKMLRKLKSDPTLQTRARDYWNNIRVVHDTRVFIWENKGR